jgi:hypothetical protein
MIGAQLRLKQPTGWFAAGKDVAQALNLLSDGAFKLFMWICLNADRGLGAIRIEPVEIARVMGKTEVQIRANLEDLFQAEIGQPTATEPFGLRIATGHMSVRRLAGKRKISLSISISSNVHSWSGAVYAVSSQPPMRKSLSSFSMLACPSRMSNMRFCWVRCGSMLR